MTEKIVQLDRSEQSSSIRNYLTVNEYSELKTLCAHPANRGHIVFDQDSAVLERNNVDDSHAAALANVFDICGALIEPFGQKKHVATTFEGRDMEITCRRFSELRLVVLRGKGNQA